MGKRQYHNGIESISLFFRQLESTSVIWVLFIRAPFLWIFYVPLQSCLRWMHSVSSSSVQQLPYMGWALTKLQRCTIFLRSSLGLNQIVYTTMIRRLKFCRLHNNQLLLHILVLLMKMHVYIQALVCGALLVAEAVILPSLIRRRELP